MWVPVVCGPMLTGCLCLQEMGLVNHVVAPNEVMGKAMEIAKKITANAPLAVQAAKHMMRQVRKPQPNPCTVRGVLDSPPLNPHDISPLFTACWGSWANV